ncbi:hypothetical protein ACWDGI_25330 [Streptomyces sp. NPDC001220]
MADAAESRERVEVAAAHLRSTAEQPAGDARRPTTSDPEPEPEGPQQKVVEAEVVDPPGESAPQQAAEAGEAGEAEGAEQLTPLELARQEIARTAD